MNPASAERLVRRGAHGLRGLPDSFPGATAALFFVDFLRPETVVVLRSPRGIGRVLEAITGRGVKGCAQGFSQRTQATNFVLVIARL